MSPPPPTLEVSLAVTVTVAAAYDLRYRRIPNWLVVAGAVAGIGLNTFYGSWAGLRMSLAGFGLAFGGYFLFYLLRGMGAGDVKLMGAVGAMVGPANWLVLFICTSLIGGVVAVVLLLLRGRLGRTLKNVGFVLWSLVHLQPPYAREELDLSSPKSLKLPHGLVIAFGAGVFLALAWAQ